MRILPHYKCIYIHIPKTAGNSIESTLDKLSQTKYRKTFRKHIKAQQMKQAVGNQIWATYFTFAFVRNPWALMVSSYHWWLQKASKWPINKPHVKNIEDLGNFTQFLKSKYGQTMLNEIEGNMFDWLTEDGTIIVDFVGTVESLDQDWKKVLTKIQAPYIPLPHLNRTKHKPYQHYYTPETRSLVAKRFHKTITTFKYEF